MGEYVFILGAHKSGTSLVRAMFDGHPRLDVVPIESHFFELAGWPILYPYKRQPATAFDFKTFRSKARNLIEEYNSAQGFTSDVNLFGRFDLDVFDEHMKDESDTINESTIIKYFNAIKASLGMPLIDTHKIIVEKSIENMEMAWAIKLLLPKAKFIHIVKNPYHNLVSIRKFKTVNNSYPSLQEILGCLRINFHFVEVNQMNIADYLVVRYEDLVLNQTETISKICDFVGLENNASLSNPSVMGEPWKGNSVTGKALKKIDKSPLAYWKAELKPIEIRYINKYFDHVFGRFKYDKIEDRTGFFRINKNESLKTFVRNRLIRIFD